MTKVALMTTLMDAPPAYGIVPVVLNQIKMLSKFHNDPPIGLFMVEGYDKHPDYKDLPENIKLEPYVPFLHLFDYQLGTKKQVSSVEAEGKPKPVIGKAKRRQNVTNFDSQVHRLEYMLEEELIRYDVIITHDIMFQTWFLVHNQAVRNIAKRHPELRWIHWLHSGPNRWAEENITGVHRLRFTGMKNSVWITPNESMASGFAQMYDVPKKYVKVVYHVVDPTGQFRHHWSKQLVEKHDLLNCDVLDVWPTRMDAPVEKGMFLTINIMAKMNKLCNAKILFLNSWSNTSKAKNNIHDLKLFAEQVNLPAENLAFSSEMGSEWETGVPQEVVHDMYEIANLFIFPSQTETFSYAMAEAALHKNLLVLNEKLTVMKELAGNRAEYLVAPAEWGGKRTDVTYHSGLDGYCMGRAEELWQTLQRSKPLMQARHVIKTFSDRNIWGTQLKPLIEGKK